MKTEHSRMAAFTLVEIMIVVAIIGLLAAIAIPNFVRARATSQTDVCINNLRQIDSAKQQWALETRQLSAAVPAVADIAPYMGYAVGGLIVNTTGGQVAGELNCPASGAYTINRVDTAPSCNIPNHILN